MPSIARQQLGDRLADVDELIAAHGFVTGGGRGAPPVVNGRRQGRALVRAGIVLQCAAAEAFVVDIFEEAAAHLYNTMTPDDLKRLAKETSRKLHTASIYNIETLFFNIGIPFVMSDITWQGMSDDNFTKSFNGLIEARNSIAHGRHYKDGAGNVIPVRLQLLRRWRSMVANFSARFERIVREHIERSSQRPLDW